MSERARSNSYTILIFTAFLYFILFAIHDELSVRAVRASRSRVLYAFHPSLLPISGSHYIELTLHLMLFSKNGWKKVAWVGGREVVCSTEYKWK